MSTGAFLAAALRGEVAPNPEVQPRPIAADAEPLYLGSDVRDLRARPDVRATVDAGIALASRLGWDPLSEATGQPWPFDVPPDYRALIDRVRPTALPRGLQLLGPDPTGDSDIAEANRRDHLVTEEALAEDRRAVTCGRIHPAPGGLRLWGVLASGQSCYWLPIWPNPDSWPIVVRADDPRGWQRLDMATATFIERWLDDDLHLAALRPMAGPPSAQSLQQKMALLRTIIGPGRNTVPYDLAAVAEALGVDALPDDYVAILSEYGQSVLDWLTLHIPENGTFQVAEYTEAGPTWIGGPENQDAILWRTIGPDPDRWLIVADDVDQLHDQPGTLIDYLIDVCIGRSKPPVLGFSPNNAPRRPYWLD